MSQGDLEEKNNSRQESSTEFSQAEQRAQEIRRAKSKARSSENAKSDEFAYNDAEEVDLFKSETPIGKEAKEKYENVKEFSKDKVKDVAKEKAKAMGRKAVAKKGGKLAQSKLVNKVLASTAQKGVLGSALGAALPYIAAAIIVIFMIIGLVAMFVYMPGFLKDDFLRGVKTFVRSFFLYDAEAGITSEVIHDLGNYTRKMGFNLYGDGFIYNKLDESDVPSGSYYSKPEGVAIDEGTGKITKIHANESILERYALMNAYTYSIEDDGLLPAFSKAVAGLFKDSKKTDYGPDREAEDGDQFKGMIRLRLAEGTDYEKLKDNGVVQDVKNFLSQNKLKAKVDIDSKTMSIKAGWFNNPYIFDIEGWSGRYGMPTELLLALHKSIMAPDLIDELISGTKIEDGKYKKTKVIVSLIKSEGIVESGFKVPDDTSINGQLYDSAHNLVDPQNIDFAKVKSGEITYYARIGTEGNYHYFPLKTNEGPVDILMPSSMDEELGIPKTDTKYDITDMYIDLANNKVRSIPGYIIHSEEAKTLIDQNKSAFILNYGLQNLMARFAKENQVKKFFIFNTTNVEGFTKYIKKVIKLIDDDSAHAFIPLIYKVEDHWFRDVYFYMDDGKKYTKIDEDYFIKSGEYWSKFKQENGVDTKEVDYQTNSGVWKAYKIEKLTADEMKAGFTAYISDPNSDDVPKEIKALEELGDIIQIKENLNIRVTQVEDGRRGETNKRTLDLFANKKWYVYDGSEETATKINEDRKNNSKSDKYKSHISENTSLLAGGILLEQMDNLDAEYAYRDYKELLLELGYHKKEDMSEKIRRVMQWPVPSASPGKIWPAIKEAKDDVEFGVKILSKNTTDELTNKALKDESGNDITDEEIKTKRKQHAQNRYGKGFKAGDKVLSPVTGKIVKQEGNSIEIEVLNNKDQVPAYKHFYEDEYKNRIAGYVVKINNINVGVTDESQYKEQIPAEAIERIANEKDRKKVEEAEKAKKDAPSRIGEYIKEGTVIGTTTEEDVQMIMYDMDRTILEHLDKYIIVPYSNFFIEFQEDYMVKITEGYPNQLGRGDVEIFKKMFDSYPVIKEYADAFLEMQEKYKVNAIFAAAVSIIESSGGTNFSAIPREYNNMFSITGEGSGEWHYGTGPSAAGSTNPRKWRKYKSFREGIMDFGKLIAEGSYYFKANRFKVSEIAKPYAGESEFGGWSKAVNKFMTNALKKAAEAENAADVPTTDLPSNREEAEKQSIEDLDDLFTRQPFNYLRLGTYMSEYGRTNGGGGYLSDEDLQALLNNGGDNPALSKDKVMALVREAESHLGKPYVFGAAGPNTFDCSGYVCYVYTHSGAKNMPRTTANGIYNSYSRPISPSEARIGDLVFFHSTYGPAGEISHIGIYLGNNTMIHAGSPIGYAKIDNAYWREHFYGFARITP